MTEEGEGIMNRKRISAVGRRLPDHSWEIKTADRTVRWGKEKM